MNINKFSNIKKKKIMEKYMFSICKSIKTPAQMQFCTPEHLNAVFDNQQVSDTCQEIARHLAEVKEGTLTREASNLSNRS